MKPTVDGHAVGVARRNAGMLREDLCKAAALSVARLEHIETRATVPVTEIGEELLSRLAAAVGVSQTEFLNGRRPDESPTTSQLIATLLCHGSVPIAELARSLEISPRELATLIDALNGTDNGIEVITTDGDATVVADLADVRTIARPDEHSYALDKVLDEIVHNPDAAALHTPATLRRLRDVGLIRRINGRWRPVDDVIEALQADCDDEAVLRAAAMWYREPRGANAQPHV
jgi:transcriptional regulator with XRE-family HTH domain